MLSRSCFSANWRRPKNRRPSALRWWFGKFTSAQSEKEKDEMADVTAEHRHSHNPFRYTICHPLIVQRLAAEELKKTHNQRHTFQRIHSDQFLLKWVVIHLRKERHDKTHHGEKASQMATESVRQEDDDGETRLPRQSHSLITQHIVPRVLYRSGVFSRGLAEYILRTPRHTTCVDHQ